MADNSKFTLRWEIDNATAVHAAGKAESKVFNEGGFEWKIKMRREGGYANITLEECGLNHYQHWQCMGNMSLRLISNDGACWTRNNKKFLFDDNNTHWCPQFDGFSWSALILSNYCVNDKVILEFPIHIISSDRGEPSANVDARFVTPDSRSNVILKIGDQKLHISKECLAVQSPVFEALFFGDYAEKGKEEVEIKDIIFEEFVDLLNVVYLVSEITDRSVLHILKLADRFQMKYVLDLSLKHLIKSKNFDAVQCLIMADQYRLVALRDHCLKSFSTASDLHAKLKSPPEVANFSDETKAAICDRILKLNL